MALIVLLAMISVGVLNFVVEQLDAAAVQRQRDEATTRALAQARDALIAYAVSGPFTGSGARRPGDLPCPDRDDDGKAGAGAVSSCGNAAGTTYPERRIGRLPWKDLGLADIRDASGERLWYAVSSNYKRNSPYYPLNSDTPGTISIRMANGGLVSDVVAVIIAPGAPLLRLGDGSIQNRGGANSNVPQSYLDRTLVTDNAAFADDGAHELIAGPVIDNTGNVQVNDRMVWITRNDLMSGVERRVLQEAAHCLDEYAQGNPDGLYPWAAAVDESFGDPLSAAAYTDKAGVCFGRFAASLDNSQASNGNLASTWGASCYLYFGSNYWFRKSWSDRVFYAIASTLAPASTGSCGPSSLSVNSNTGAKFIVLASGRKLGAQSRTTDNDRKNVINFLEGENATPADGTFAKQPASASFNDLLAQR